MMVFVACDHVLAHDTAEPEDEDQSQTAAFPAHPVRPLSDLDGDQQLLVPIAKHHDGRKLADHRIHAEASTIPHVPSLT